MEPKALFLDLDGTLLDDKKELTPGNRAAMEQALAAGHHLIISTGRPLVSARIQAARLGLDGPGCYLIAFNGGILYDFGAEKVIFRQTLPLELVSSVFREANARGLHIQTYSNTCVVVEERCNDALLEEYCGLTMMGRQVLEDIHDLEEEPVKMLAADWYDHKALEAFQAWILQELGEELDSFFSSQYYLEIVPRGLNKGRAVLQMAELLGLPQENTIAAGDAANDLSMIQTAHVGIAMCNGTEEVRAAADDITEWDNNHDGIAWIIRKYLL